MQGMMSSGRYSRAPVTEAIIAFQVELPEEVKLSDLERCQDAAYPTKRILAAQSGAPEGGNGAAAPSQPEGFLFVSADDKQLFQARSDGFLVHRLAPYAGWEPFRDEARRLWGLYRQAVCPRRVARLAVRCINRLDLPLPVVEVKDYLRTFPEVSPDLPQGLAEFFLQLSIPQQDLKSTLLLREMAVPPAGPGVASVVLDIDLFRADDVPAEEAGVWDLLDHLHTRENEVFEACITDRTREVIR